MTDFHHHRDRDASLDMCRGFFFLRVTILMVTKFAISVLPSMFFKLDRKELKFIYCFLLFEYPPLVMKGHH